MSQVQWEERAYTELFHYLLSALQDQKWSSGRSDLLHWLLHMCMCAHFSNGLTSKGNLSAVKWKKFHHLNPRTVSLRRHLIFVGFYLMGEETSQGMHIWALSWREVVNSLQDKAILASSSAEKGFLVLVMEVEYDSLYFPVPLDR